MKETKKITKKPTSAFTMYIQLYCKKRTGKSKYHSTFLEAAKSWLTLNSEEKEKINQKYLDYCEKLRKSYANSLKKTEPYLKKKKERVDPKTVDCGLNISVQTEPSVTHDLDIRSSLFSMAPESNLLDNEFQVEQNNSTLSFIDKSRLPALTELPEPNPPIARIDDEIQMEQNNTLTTFNKQPALTRLPEPMPPTVRTAKDLFDTVSTLHEGTNCKWEFLSQTQKRRYQSAALALKKDYIRKYKGYLESLPSHELFEHYCNKS